MLSPLQAKLVEILGWFHNFCTENNITYYAAEGTMLGAMRHKGIIPWDDDIDVVVPRPDYKRLIKLFNRQIDKYVLETPYSKNYYPYQMAKLYDTKTTLVEKLNFEFPRGVYLDIFPLDGAGNSKTEAVKRLNKFLFVQKLHSLHFIRTGRKDRSLVRNITCSALKNTADLLFDVKKTTQYLDKIASSADYNGSSLVALYGSAYKRREIMKKEIYGTPKQYRFESIVINGVEMPNEYLTAIYGNWRAFPPPEKRQSTHSRTLVDLNKSYLDYKERSK